VRYFRSLLVSVKTKTSTAKQEERNYMNSQAQLIQLNSDGEFYENSKQVVCKTFVERKNLDIDVNVSLSTSLIYANRSWQREYMGLPKHITWQTLLHLPPEKQGSN
jgi:hypothetical protein